MPEIILAAFVVCLVENCKFSAGCNGKNPKRNTEIKCDFEALQQMKKRELTTREVIDNKNAIIRKAYFSEEDTG
jgi:hypothetical protein